MPIGPGDDYWVIWRGASDDYFAGDEAPYAELRRALKFETEDAVLAKVITLNGSGEDHYVQAVKRLGGGMTAGL